MRAARDLLSPLGVALVLTGAAVFFGDGPESGALPWIGGAAVVAAVVFTAAHGLPAGWPALVPLAALAGWCAVSVAWSAEPDRSWDYANRALVYVAFAGLGALAGTRSRALAAGLAAILGAAVVWALAGKVLPWLYEDYGRIARLRAPVGYWNGLALLGDVALPLALWLAARRRAAGTLLVFAWLVALVLTYSRGGLLVAALVVVAWLALAGSWLDTAATLVAAGVPAAGVVGIAFALPGVTDDGQSHASRVHDGLLFGVALAAGAVVAVALARAPRPRETPALRRAALAAAGVIAAAVIVVGALNAGTAWSEFTSESNTQLSNASGRFAEAGSNHRWVWWKQAWHGFRDEPLAGTGAGTFHLTNLRYRTTYLDEAREPHDLPLQFLSETGIVGLALFVLAAAVLVRAARRRDAAELTLALALPAYLVHALLDIDWDFLAVTAPALVAAGAVAARPAVGRRPSPFAGLIGAGVALAVLSSLFAVWLADRWTNESIAALDRPARAIELARRARSVDPLAIDPLYWESVAENARGRPREAYALLRKATEIQPQNPEAWFRLGDFAYTSGCPRLALPALEKFAGLDPQDRKGSEHQAALDAVNSGKPSC